MSKVVVTPVGEKIEEAVEAVFGPFGGIRDLLAGRTEAFVKVNAVDFKPYTFTDPEVLAAAVRVLRRAGARRVYVMENCTQANFTRLVFRASGLEKASREADAVPLYLDEGPQEEVTLPSLGYPVRVSRWVKERLVDGPRERFYLNIPKLKTHSMTDLTLGVKCQLGLIGQGDRIQDHNENLHRKLADIYALVRPDFTLIDGIHALNHGHYPPSALAEDCAERLGILLGGTDTLAVDAVAADLLGFDPSEVEHLRLAAETAEGTIRLEEIEVVGDRAPYRRSYSSDLLPVFPGDVTLVKGKKRCCREGCRGNTLAVLQTLYVDFRGKGGFTICMGEGLDRRELDRIRGRVLVVGDCAAEEAAELLARRLGRRSVRVVRGCNNLRDIVLGLASLMGVNPLKMVPLPPWETSLLLLRALARRTTARIALPFLPTRLPARYRGGTPG